MYVSFHGVTLVLETDASENAEWVTLNIKEHGETPSGITIFPTVGRFAFLEDLRNQIETEMERLMKLGDPKLEEVSNDS